MTWTDGDIEGCIIRPLSIFEDSRGWLTEVFRTDELEADLHPAMGYLSSTLPNVARGPHEHVSQTDLFAFFAGEIQLFLWDARTESSSRGNRIIRTVGESDPVVVIVPPGVVHAYKNVGRARAIILNCPNRLYGGPDRSEPVDEIRHEDSDRSIFSMDEGG